MRRISQIIGILLLTTTFHANADDKVTLELIYKKIQEIESRLVRVEALLSDSDTTQNQSESDDLDPEAAIALLKLSLLAKAIQEADAKPEVTGLWSSIENWRRLQRDMGYDEVREILGEPERIEGGTFTHWYYPNGGMAVFYDDDLDRWKEP